MHYIYRCQMQGGFILQLNNVCARNPGMSHGQFNISKWKWWISVCLQDSWWNRWYVAVAISIITWPTRNCVQRIWTGLQRLQFQWDSWSGLLGWMYSNVQGQCKMQILVVRVQEQSEVLSQRREEWQTSLGSWFRCREQTLMLKMCEVFFWYLAVI